MEDPVGYTINKKRFAVVTGVMLIVTMVVGIGVVALTRNPSTVILVGFLAVLVGVPAAIFSSVKVTPAGESASKDDGTGRK